MKRDGMKVVSDGGCKVVGGQVGWGTCVIPDGQQGKMSCRHTPAAGNKVAAGACDGNTAGSDVPKGRPTYFYSLLSLFIISICPPRCFAYSRTLLCFFSCSFSQYVLRVPYSYLSHFFSLSLSDLSCQC